MNDKNKLLDKKKHGDLKTIGAMMGITPFNAYNLLNRPRAKRHPEAMAALKKVVDAREQLIAQSRTNK